MEQLVPIQRAIRRQSATKLISKWLSRLQQGVWKTFQANRRIHKRLLVAGKTRKATHGIETHGWVCSMRRLLSRPAPFSELPKQLLKAAQHATGSELV